MNNKTTLTAAEKHRHNISQYYRIHSYIYDATRWSFLFGRTALVKHIPALPPNPQILEVGCGTGKNIIQLKQRFPDAQITGVDLSPHMLKKARKKITDSSTTFKKMHYSLDNLNKKNYDLILFSYSLTMMGIEYSQIITRIKNDLSPNGYLAIVDFHTSPFSWFTNWMEINHVDLSGNLYPRLENNFKSKQISFHRAYLGLWNYFQFIATKN